jgi:hemerythrin-like domain-containing protein
MSAARLEIVADDQHRAPRTTLDAFDELAREHRIIQRVAAGLVRWAHLGEHQSDDGRLELRRFVSFLRHFVVHCHFGKESAVALGPAAGREACAESIAEMEVGHAACSRLIHALHQRATMHTVWSRPERREVARLADELADTLRDVFVVEETRVFPQLRAALPSTLLSGLHERLVAHERLHTGSGEHERHVSMAEALARWGDPVVPR